MKFILLIALISIFIDLRAQEVTILRTSDTTVLTSDKHFIFIQPATDTSKLVYIKTIRASQKLKKKKQAVISALYAAIREKAKEYNANCFKLNKYGIIDSSKTIFLDLDTYYAEESLLNANSNNRPKYGVYILGGESNDTTKSRLLAVDDSEKNIHEQSYYFYSLNPGEPLKLSKGGLIGTTAILHGRIDRYVEFYSIGGLTLANSQYYQPGISVGFTAGTISLVEDNFGYLLLKIYSPSR